MYSLQMYLQMIKDKVRMTAYQAAIKASVKPGDVVLDLGAGTGIMSFLALEAGASRVYAIETNDAIDLIRRIAKANGFDGRLICFQEDSLRLSLPEPVDVIVSDIRGNMPLYANNLQVLTDARKRFLKPDGRLIPEIDTIQVAPIENQKAFSDIEAWRQTPAKADLGSIAALAANQMSGAKIKLEDLLAPAQAMPPIHYDNLQSYDFSMKARYTVTRQGICHGLGLWFESELCPGVKMSNAPGVPATVYGQTYFPLEHAYPVLSGDKIDVDIQARYAGQEHIWIWNVVIEAKGKPRVEERHSSFQGTVFSAEQFRKTAENYVPNLNQNAKIDLLILKLMEEKNSLGDIARRITDQFPASFPGLQEALTRAGDLSRKYSESQTQSHLPPHLNPLPLVGEREG
jgi:protein arginine N-methyltransferase 1